MHLWHGLPGGYQLIGRTLPIWNKFLKNPLFARGAPWLLRFFDQVQFYPVSEAELDRLREDFREGRATVRIEHDVFDYAAYRQSLVDSAHSIAAFQARQQAAFSAEVAHWKAHEANAAPIEVPAALRHDEHDGHAVMAEMSGSVWKVLVQPGEQVRAGQPLLVVEAMKMELTVLAPVAGTLLAMRCRAGSAIKVGDRLASIA